METLIPTTRPRFADPDTPSVYQIGQDTPRRSDGGKLLLLECPVCRRAWVRQGRTQILLEPSEEQVFALATWLRIQVDPATGTWRLPRSVCPDCCALELGGLFFVETYPPADASVSAGESDCAAGYRFIWQDPQRYLACMLSRTYRSASTLLRGEPDLLLGSREHASQVLLWLVHLRLHPAGMFDLNATEQTLLTERLAPRPASIAPYHERLGPRVWRTFAALSDCPSLGGRRTLVILASSEHPASHWEPEETLRDWRWAAEHMLQSRVW